MSPRLMVSPYSSFWPPYWWSSHTIFADLAVSNAPSFLDVRHFFGFLVDQLWLFRSQRTCSDDNIQLIFPEGDVNLMGPVLVARGVVGSLALGSVLVGETGVAVAVGSATVTGEFLDTGAPMAFVISANPTATAIAAVIATTAIPRWRRVSVVCGAGSGPHGALESAGLALWALPVALAAPVVPAVPAVPLADVPSASGRRVSPAAGEDNFGIAAVSGPVPGGPNKLGSISLLMVSLAQGHHPRFDIFSRARQCRRKVFVAVFGDKDVVFGAHADAAEFFWG